MCGSRLDIGDTEVTDCNASEESGPSVVGCTVFEGVKKRLDLSLSEEETEGKGDRRSYPHLPKGCAHHPLCGIVNNSRLTPSLD